MPNHDLYETLQSGNRNQHSMEAAAVKMSNYLLIASDSGCISMLVRLELIAVAAKVLLQKVGVFSSTWMVAPSLHPWNFIPLVSSLTLSSPMSHT